MMLGEDSTPARFWERCGQEAMRRGIKKVILMGAHWESPGDTLLVAGNPEEPKKQPVAWVEPERVSEKYRASVSGRREISLTGYSVAVRQL